MKEESIKEFVAFAKRVSVISADIASGDYNEYGKLNFVAMIGEHAIGMRDVLNEVANAIAALTDEIE